MNEKLAEVATATDANAEDERERDLRDGAERLDSELRCVAAYLKVFQGLAASMPVLPQEDPAERLVQIEASAFDLVMEDLTMRCARVGQSVLNLAYVRRQ